MGPGDGQVRGSCDPVELPAGVRSVLDRFSLHDARVLVYVHTKVKGKKRKDWLSLFVRLEGTFNRPGKELELRYTLAAPPKTHKVYTARHGGDMKDSRGRVWIQYDEFGVVVGKPSPIFSHSLLLTNGDELRIRFTDLHVQPYKKVTFHSFEQAGFEAV